ncbi:DUF58 domain-containing protein [Alkalimonas delamerensis]|uniref:DUF58 domain-containing protein n=1 Tax=Alkalimonas delamerensis TaxID=265981 RepID=A0ABT9GNX1_9GAMM|nr:DUF58 domain-containing protein [Alkalimonas delamerensis]MDP4528659.1 DUF58 domain-containing protein [Alkalimonas delamerensis]
MKRLQRYRQQVQRLMQRWLAKKFNSASSFQLNHATLLVFPTRYGFWFVLLIVLLYLLGTNYQNNLILLLGYLLLSVFVLSIWFAWRNLAGLCIELQPPEPIHAGQSLQLNLRLSSRHGFQALKLSCHNSSTVLSNQQQAALRWTEPKRGHYQTGVLTIASDYPLGLIRCWSYLPAELSYWVYPAPLPPQQPAHGAAQTEDQQQQLASSLPEQLKNYQPGDPIKRLHWKRLARQPDHPVVRVAEQSFQADPRWLEVPPLQGAALEQCLSEVCYQLLALESKGQPYGLRTPKGQLEPALGPLHLQQCLQRLALC